MQQPAACPNCTHGCLETACLHGETACLHDMVRATAVVGVPMERPVSYVPHPTS